VSRTVSTGPEWAFEIKPASQRPYGGSVGETYRFIVMADGA
jgi:hypothetical protein